MSGSNARVVWRSEITECVPSHFPEAEEHKASGANPDPNRARRQDTSFSSFVPAAPVFRAPLILPPRVVRRRRA